MKQRKKFVAAKPFEFYYLNEPFLGAKNVIVSSENIIVLSALYTQNYWFCSWCTTPFVLSWPLIDRNYAGSDKSVHAN